MAEKTAIEWTDATWNPTSGCTKVSPGCAHCYAETLTLRFHRGGPFLPGKSAIHMHYSRLNLPLTWHTPKKIFVNSMSDLFHEDIPLRFIKRVFSTMVEAKHHTFQILTKRAERLAKVYDKLPWAKNIWMGVSVENQYWANKRIPLLLEVPASVRFLSCEPLLRPLNLERYLPDLQWVIVGGESGPHARPVDLIWIRNLRDQCQLASVPFFLKQLGGHPNKRGHEKALLDGQLFRQMPCLYEHDNKKVSIG